MKNKPVVDISVVVLNYNTRDLTRTCIKTLLASELEDYIMEVIVCDNGSADDSIEMLRKLFPQVILIDNKKNLGFAAGNNPGIRIAKGRYVLLLNSDTETPPNTILSMIEYMDKHPQVGASTCKVVLSNGSIDPACHRGFPTPWAAFTYLIGLEKLFPKSKLFGQYHQGYKDMTTIHEVDCIVGAFFLVRKEVIVEVGQLDEDYFMYAEDIDWAFRIVGSGWKIVYIPTVSILHMKKQSGRSHFLRNRRQVTEIYFHKYNWLFYKKHYAQKYPILISTFINLFYTLRIFFLEKLRI